MIGLVLVTHGRLAEEFAAALEHVVGPQDKIAAISIGPEDDMELRRQDVHEKIDLVDEGDGVILLTDMFGGTPSNLAMSFLDKPNIEVIAGINLPMLIRLAGARKKKGLLETAKAARDAGRNYITIASEFLGEEGACK